MCVDYDSALGDCFEEIDSGQVAVIVEIEKFECLEQDGIVADLG